MLTQVEETCAVDRIPFSYFELEGSTEMKAVIRKDMMVLCSGEVGMKAAPKKSLANEHTSEHATCSSTKFIANSVLPHG